MNPTSALTRPDAAPLAAPGPQPLPGATLGDPNGCPPPSPSRGAWSGGLGAACGAALGMAAALGLESMVFGVHAGPGLGAAGLGAILGAALGGVGLPAWAARAGGRGPEATAALLDPVTGLPNRTGFFARVEAELRGPDAAAGAPRALLLVGLDRLRALNDGLGHEVGDRWLHEAAARLAAAFDPPARIGRLGSDEFALVVPVQALRADDTTLAGLGESLLQRLRRPFSCDGGEHHLTASAGGSWLAGDTPIEQGLREADLALRRAKRAGRDCMRVFEPGMQAEARERARLLASLRQAVHAQEFRLHYQPQVDRAGRVVGAEALLRWNSPELGPVEPSRFIPLAEESGLIVPIGRAVIRDACGVLAWWAQDPATAHLTLSVNVSPQQFQHPEFAEEVRLALQTAGVAPRLLKLEITESVVIGDLPGVQAQMHALRALGVRLSLDDFGVGYSSLSYLKHLPLSQLKIDQVFVRHILDDPREAALVRAVITLARELALELVAEGVETPEQREMLSELGCSLYQGYLFGRPVPLEALCVVQ